MNPGKLIDPVAVYDATENLRHGSANKLTDSKNWFTFASDQGSFGDATGRCVGVGACRKVDHGTMCPSYMVTREEKHSTRGRAHLLWELMHGEVMQGGWQNAAVKESLDLCLSCKACKTECPVNVDMATWKAEFLAHHYAGRLHPLQHYAFGYMDRWAKLASAAPRLANLSLSIPGVNGLVKSLLGIAPQRELPPFASRKSRNVFRSAVSSSNAQGKPVLLWPDTWNKYFYPQALTAAAQVLTSSGYRVQTPRKHICCGRPLYDFGFLDEARRYLRRILDMFKAEIEAGLPVVMLEPSCASVFRDELMNFFPDDEVAKRLSRQTVMLSELLHQERGTWQPPDLRGKQVVVQGHCHQKALLSMDDDMALLRSTGAGVELLDSGCCGMAGPFGFEKDKFAVSQALAERVLLPAVRAADEETIFVSNGFSCREQIQQNSSRRALHLAEVLAGQL